ncbi:MAG: hypothetical protein HKO57_06275 [Akkermansiaceae bacterium]|nr:hypothetical protein [Akkermansiaceae bacterium]
MGASANSPEARSPARPGPVARRSARTALAEPWLAATIEQARENGRRFAATLPDGQRIQGRLREPDPARPGVVEGRLSHPAEGTFYFRRGPGARDGAPGPLTHGLVFTRDGSVAWRLEPAGPGRAPVLAATAIEGVLCHADGRAGIPEVPDGLVPDEEQILLPEDHPPLSNNPSYQPTVPALESRPGSLGVLYLDFDGGTNSDVFWGTFNVQHSGKSPNDIIDIWARVAEDFLPFDVNVTTDLAVYEAGSPGRRQRCWITSTSNAIGNAGGVAVLQSYKLPDDIACWARPYGNASCALVVSHEFGHTLGLVHDGNSNRAYSSGFGSGAESWGPIMGAPYGKTLTIWNDGDYADANNGEDDLALIAANPGVGNRPDEVGDTPGEAPVLRVFADGTIDDRHIIETPGDVDVYTFRTTGGAISIDIEAADVGPNMNCEGTLYDSTGAVIVTQNNPSSRNVTLGATLAAGDYFLEVDGGARTGPNPFSDYGILGGFKVTGTIVGVMAPQFIPVAEQTPVLTAIGTVTPWETHGIAPTFALTGGNDDNLFAVDPATGVITVAAPIDYEALYTDWRYPPEYYLRVLITSPGVSEERTVIVPVTDVNEPPVFVSTFDEVVLENTAAGVDLGRVEAQDDDPFSPVTYAITAGDPGGADPYFEVDPDSGVVRTRRVTDLAPGTIVLTLEATDAGAPPASATATVELEVIAVAAGLAPGSHTQLTYTGIPGATMNSLYTAPVFPDCPEILSFAEGLAFLGFERDYGLVMQGHFVAPETGSYQFWIAADDAANLPPVPNARVLSGTTVEGFDESATQTVAGVPLIAGQPYYFEARMKQGDDAFSHLSVAWQRPLAPARAIIPARFLSPIVENYPPKARRLSFPVRVDSFPHAPLGNVRVVDPNVDDTLASLVITAGDPGGLFSLDLDGTLAVADPSALPAPGTDVVLTVEATDHHGATGSADITITTRAADVIALDSLEQEVFWGIAGNRLSDLFADPRYPCRPDASRYLAQMDTGQGLGDQYGSRIRAAVTPTVSGTYRFHIAGDDECRLLFGADGTAGSATVIASIATWTGYQQWDKFASQQSAEIVLTAGESYYLEALHKEGGGGDHLSVGWTLPGAGEITLIPAAELSPVDLNCPPVIHTAERVHVEGTLASSAAVLTMDVTDPEGEALTFAILSGNEGGLFHLDPRTGELVTTSAVAPGHYPLEIAVQDQGRGGVYPLAEASLALDLEVGYSTYDAWAAAQWGAGHADLARTGPLEDFDFDGILNFMEFLILGEDPQVRRGLRDMLTEIGVEGEPHWELALDFNTCGPGTLAVAFSTDLEAWTTAQPPGDGASVVVDGTGHSLVVRFRLGAFEKLFIRLEGAPPP